MSVQSTAGSRISIGNDRWERIAFPLAMALMFVLAFALRQSSLLNHDSSWYLYATARLLEGQRLYVDIVELNPPLSFMLTVPPVALSQFLSLDPTLVFYLYIFVLAALSLALTARLMRGMAEFSRGQRQVVLLAMAFVLMILPGKEFGQREHFALIFTWPYMLLAAQRSTKASVDWRFGAMIGGLAFLGYGLKPHFLLVPVALELYLFFSTRRLKNLFRPETLVLGSALVAYLAGIYFFTPDYLGRVVPYALEVYNQAYRVSLFHTLYPTAALPVLLLYMGLRAPEGKQRLTSAAKVFLIAGTAFLLAFAFQRKGWNYHLVPALGCLATAAFIVLVNVVSNFEGDVFSNTPKGRLRLVWLTMMVVLLSLVVVRSARLQFYFNPETEMLAGSAEFKRPVSSYYAFSTRLWPGFPLVNELAAHWSSRFPTQWLLPGLMRAKHDLARDPNSHDAALIDEIETYNRNAVVSDLLRNPPELVAVDARKYPPYFGDLPFDFLAYYKRDPRFEAFWKDYELVDKVQYFKIFRRHTK